MEAAPASCAIQIVQGNGEDQCIDFKPLTSGQLLLATRRKSGTHNNYVETQLHDCEEDAEGECFLSKFLAASLTLLVCGFIYFVVLQQHFLPRNGQQ
ncbi:hypothetical protein BBJ28_00015461 [Nothophytophthora sp. Chile5]|nr:hypothetical protein BBJ28_00015461 [Nothophytophthora sp. Chile5]